MKNGKSFVVGYATTVDYGGLRNYIRPETLPKVKVYAFNTIFGKLLGLFNRFLKSKKINEFRDLHGRFIYYGGVSVRPAKLVHMWNGICVLPRPWITTFEDTLPRSLYAFRALRQTLAVPPFGFRFMASRHCKKLIALSKSAVHRTKLILNSCPPNWRERILQKIVVLYPPQPIITEDLKRFDDLKTIRFIFVGGSFWHKGGEESFLVLKKLRHEGLPVELTIVSALGIETGTTHPVDNAYRDNMRASFERESDWCHYFPRLANQRVLELISTSHVLLLPTHSDTFGYSVLEGQACGCPVITTDVFALPEINNDECGWVIRVPKEGTNDAYYGTDEQKAKLQNTIEQQLEKTVREICKAPQCLKTKAVRALDRIRREHNPVLHAQTLKRIYAEAFQ